MSRPACLDGGITTDTSANLSSVEFSPKLVLIQKPMMNRLLSNDPGRAPTQDPSCKDSKVVVIRACAKRGLRCVSFTVKCPHWASVFRRLG